MPRIRPSPAPLAASRLARKAASSGSDPDPLPARSPCRLPAALAVLAVLAGPLAPAAGPVLVAGPGGGDVVARVLEALAAAREAASAPPLERRPGLDRAAAARARAIARLPHDRRLALDEPIEAALRRAGVDGVVVARLHVELSRGRAEPARGVVGNWRAYGQAWSAALAPALDAVGAAAVRADDGWLVFVAVLVEDAPPAPERRDAGRLEREILAAVNEVRGRYGASPLATDGRLAAVARAHSEEMAARDFFDHVTPEGSDAADRVTREGVDYARLGENLHRSRGVEDVAAVAVASWLDSAGHRKTMLDRGFRVTGVGVAVGRDGAVWVTQLFVLPRAARPAR